MNDKNDDANQTSLIKATENTATERVSGTAQTMEEEGNIKNKA